MRATPTQRNRGLAPGTRMGRYVCLRRLAGGGMAELYLARLQHAAGFEKFFALKRIRPALAEEEGFVRMFLGEAKLSATLEHGNIVQVTDFGIADEDPYLVMEYLHGPDARTLLGAAANTAPIALEAALSIVVGVAAALEYVHAHRGPDGAPLRLVHRDVSPSNIVVTYGGRVKLLDFGVAKVSAATRATQSGTLKGKLGYLSPEQCRGEAVDGRSDIFSLGVVLYELTTGRRAFHGDNEFAILNKTSRAEFKDPAEVTVGYPPALRAIVLRALAAAPDERYASARDLRAELLAFATAQGLQLGSEVLSEEAHRLVPAPPHPRHDPDFAGPPTVIEAAVTTASPPPPPAPPHRRWSIAIALVAGAGVAATALTLWSGSSAATPSIVQPPPSAPPATAASTTPALPATSASASATVQTAPIVPALHQSDQTPALIAEPDPEPARTGAPDRGRKKRRKARPKPTRTPRAKDAKAYRPPSLRP